MSLGQILRNRREEIGLTLEEVAVRTGFSKPYLSTIETGKVKNPPSDSLLSRLERVLEFERGVLQHIAHIERMPADIRRDIEEKDAQNHRFRQIIRDIIHHQGGDVKIEGLLDGDVDEVSGEDGQIKAGKLIPVINRVSAGYPVDFDDLDYPVGFADDYVRCPDLHDANAFAVRVVGDSMEPKFFEGDIVVFSPSSQVRNGDDCFVRFTMPHESTFKRVFFEQGENIRLQPLNPQYAPMTVEGNRVNGLYRAVIRYQKL